MDNAFLRLIGVTKSFDDRRVVDDLSIDVQTGDIVALLGESGCGKTTTIRIIAGLEAPDEGEVWIGGERVANGGRIIKPANQRQVGFVFQDLALWPHLTVAGNLRFVLASAKIPKAEWADRIADVLKLVKIEPFADVHPGRLSGGEQQRAAIARAIVGHPRLLLFDEPMSNLDTGLKVELLQEFAALQHKLGITTIYITHDPAEAAALAHRVATMKNGRIERTGTVDEMMELLLSRSLLKAFGKTTGIDKQTTAKGERT
ncbi:ABC transporter ATP-binding protein [Geotalea sp. SG265]|uniref:ABC transporter ATP-binding protein n=1 Tax=Geotalea sp. SG265 TaxID=2922867 RepID=UPI001FAFA486|nr:ABC transporter ATP-binding protein [Geotalea sp. SG265]